MPNGNLTWLSMIVTMKKLRNGHKSIQPLRLRFGKTQQWKGNPRKDIGLNTPIPSRNALEDLSLNRNGISGSPLTQPLPRFDIGKLSPPKVPRFGCRIWRYVQVVGSQRCTP